MIFAQGFVHVQTEIDSDEKKNTQAEDNLFGTPKNNE